MTKKLWNRDFILLLQGTALSAVIYGFLGGVFPLYLVFAAGTLISLAPMLYLCFYRETKRFVLEH